MIAESSKLLQISHHAVHLYNKETYSGRIILCGPMVPFLTHYFLCIRRLTPFTSSVLVFSYSLRQIFLPIVRNTWSGLHH